jgi:hypothetical protein
VLCPDCRCYCTAVSLPHLLLRQAASTVCRPLSEQGEPPENFLRNLTCTLDPTSSNGAQCLFGTCTAATLEERKARPLPALCPHLTLPHHQHRNRRPHSLFFSPHTRGTLGLSHGIFLLRRLSLQLLAIRTPIRIVDAADLITPPNHSCILLGQSR